MNSLFQVALHLPSYVQVAEWKSDPEFAKQMEEWEKAPPRNPTPYTMHPTPYTLHPAPYTLHPETRKPKIETRNPKPRPATRNRDKYRGTSLIRNCPPP